MTQIPAASPVGSPEPGPDGSAPDDSPRFTLDGSPALERHLAEICDRVLKEVRTLVTSERLDGLVLGGGYGRGEGGVLRTAEGDAPYNDLEFYVFLKGNRLRNERLFRASLEELGERLSPGAGLHVEFKIDSLARWQRSPVSMFSYDLAAGHRVLLPKKTPGQSPLFSACPHHLEAANIPMHEATRLLMNRCTGLLMVKELLVLNEPSPEQADFIGRNLAKAQLALGDVVLAAFGRYHRSCIERHERFKELASREKFPWIADLERHHASGKEFKLHPSRIARTARQFMLEFLEISNLARQLWLWLESRRLGPPFASVREYAFCRARKCADASALRSAAVNLRRFGLAGILDPQAFRYPRERLLNTLPLLLWEETSDDPRVQRFLQKQLRTPASDWHSFAAAYKAMWPGLN